MKKKDPIEEARRYVDNAKKALRDHGDLNTELRLYQDDKYVKAAGHYLWHAVLIVLDAIFLVKTKNRPHPDIKDYKDAIAKRDHKLLDLVNSGYVTLHISMGYDGNQRKMVCDDGIQLANEIIDRCEKMIA